MNDIIALKLFGPGARKKTFGCRVAHHKYLLMSCLVNYQTKIILENSFSYYNSFVLYKVIFINFKNVNSNN